MLALRSLINSSQTGGGAGVQSSKGGVQFSKAIESWRGGGTFFVMTKKGGTIFRFCVFFPPGGQSL